MHSYPFSPSNLHGSCLIQTVVKLTRTGWSRIWWQQHRYILTGWAMPLVGTLLLSCFLVRTHLDTSNFKAMIWICEGKPNAKVKLAKSEPRFIWFYQECLGHLHQTPDDSTNAVCFFLKCCLEESCIHPLRYQVKLQPDFQVSNLPLEVPHPTQYWGNSKCQRCKGVCHGHFVTYSSFEIQSLAYV